MKNHRNPMRENLQVAKKSKILVAVAVMVMVSIISSNLSALPMHHMDASDCALQISCNNCFISASFDAPALNSSPFLCGEPLETAKLFESYKSVPVTPPPKI